MKGRAIFLAAMVLGTLFYSVFVGPWLFERDFNPRETFMVIWYQISTLMIWWLRAEKYDA